MIERLQKFAKVLNRISYILLLLAGACAGLTLLSLIDNPWLADDRWLLHSFLGFLWVLMLYTAGEVFPRLPPAVASAENWRQRLSYRLRWGMMWLLAVLFLSLCDGGKPCGLFSQPRLSMRPFVDCSCGMIRLY